MLQARELRNIAAARTVPEQNISASFGSTLQSVQQPNTDGQSKLLRAQEITVSTFEEIGSRLMKAVKGGKPGELHMLHNLTRPPDACFPGLGQEENNGFMEFKQRLRVWLLLYLALSLSLHQ